MKEVETGSVCLGRGHLTANHLENLPAKLFHCILPVVTVSKKREQNYFLGEE